MTYTKRAALILILLALLAGWFGPTPEPAQAQPPDPAATEQILITGVRLQPAPGHQVVPKNTGTAVNVMMGATAEDEPLPALPSDARVVAELRGPALPTPQRVTASPGQPLLIPPLPVKGLYRLENIRMVIGENTTLLQGEPDAVSIEVIDKLLVSQVTTRELTADEIEERGIVIDEENFDAVDFTVALGVEDQKVPINFPMLLPKSPNKPAVHPPELPALEPLGIQQPDADISAPQLSVKSIGATGFSLECVECDPEIDDLIPPLPGVIIFPGKIAFLNQFFSALLAVTNVAPDDSDLVVTDLEAEILLPAGRDEVRDTGDDPLRMARLGNPPEPQSKIQPVLRPGPDGELGTDDDLVSLPPGQEGNSEFLVEGVREGTHQVDIKIRGTLEGLPVGPVQVEGRAVGTLEVRDPKFSLTFNHPRTVSAGEEYDFFVTVTNISDSPANFASLSLLPQSMSGAELLSEETVQIDSIPPGDSATASFRVRSLETGTVIANSLASEDTPGKFELRMAVGELGIPMSPNTLQMPPAMNDLPENLRRAGISMLSQGYALATSPIVPPDLLPMSRQIVFARAIEMAAGGQRVSMGEPISTVARDLALDLTGNGLSRLDENARVTPADYEGFDLLRRKSGRGAALMDVLAGIFADDVQSQGALAFQSSFAQQAASRPAHLSAVTGSDGGPAPVVLSITAPDGAQMGMLKRNGDILRDIPHGGFFSLIESDPNYSQMGLLSNPGEGTYVVALRGTAAGDSDLGVVVPDAGQLRRLTFENVSLQAGGRARLIIDITATGTTYTLRIDADGDGEFDAEMQPTTDALVPDAGPSVVSAVQMAGLDRFGRVMGVLFDEEVTVSSAQSDVDTQQITNYAVEANKVLGTRLQPSGRVSLLRLRDGIGPFITRTVTISNVADLHGNVMDPISTTLPISSTIQRPGGTVSGQVKHADGSPVPNAIVRLEQWVSVAGRHKWVLVTQKSTDADGRYSFDYVADFPSRFTGIDPATGERSTLYTQVRYNGQHLDLDIILRGSGTIAGRALAPDGETPLPGADIGVKSVSDSGRRFVATTDDQGGFVITNVPVGNVSILAVHEPTNSQTQIAANVPTDGATVFHDLILLPLAQQSTGSVAGTVYRSDGVTPVEGATVYTSKGGVATTDASGFYRIDGLPAGGVTVEAFDQSGLETASVKTTIVENQEVTANLLLFGGTGSVRGVVLDADGAPVEGAIIGGGLQLAETDENGAFVLPEVPLGDRKITAQEPSTGLIAETTAHLTRPGEEVIVQLTLPPAGTVVGTVTRADGTPVPNLEVILFTRDSGRVYTAVTNKDGEYRADDVQAGAYMVSAYTPGFSDGEVTTTRLVYNHQTVRADVTFRGTGKLHVQVFDDDGVTPLGARLGLGEQLVLKQKLTPADNPTCRDDVQVGDQTVHLTPCRTVGIGYSLKPNNRIVDADPTSGTYEFDRVFAGKAVVKAVNPFNGDSGTEGVTIQPGRTSFVTLTLGATGVVSGTVYQPDGVTPVGKDVIVELDASGMQDVTVATDEQGHYVFPLVSPGRFRVTATDDATGRAGRSGGSVDAGGTAKIPIRLLGEGSVRVEVIGTTGDPITDTQVLLTEGSFLQTQHSGITDASGVYTFTGVTEGRFSTSATDAESGTSGFAHGTIDAPGAHTSVQILIPNEAGTVNGHFYEADGTTAIPNAQIRLKSFFDGREAFTTSDANGAFVFDGVPKAGFRVEALNLATGREGAASGEITTDGETVTITVTEQPTGTIEGYVLSSLDNSPIAGAQVSLRSSGLDSTLQTTSGLDGSYRFPGVTAGTFVLTAKDPATGFSGKASGSLSQPGETVTVDVTVDVPERGRIEGHVYEADGTTPAIGAEVKFSKRQTTVDDEGGFFFDEVPLGDFTLVATEQIGPDAGRTTGTVTFDGEVVQTDIQLIGTGTVSGTVTTADGTPVGFASVKIQRATSNPAGFSAETQTDPDGHFQFDEVLIGDFSVSASDPSTGLAGSASGSLSTPNDAISLTVVLEPSGSIVGRVLREDGTTPAAGMALELKKGGVSRFGATLDDGTFTFDDLPLGDYTLTAEDALGEGIASTTASLTNEGQTVDVGDLVLDESAPQVASMTPADGTTDVPVDQVITIQFSEPVQAGTVNDNTVIVSGPNDVIAGTRALSPDQSQLVFTPTQPLPGFANVTVKVTTGVKDLVDKPLSAEVIASFTTSDITPPTVTGLSPAPGATNVQPESVVRVEYSEAIDPAQFSEPAIQLTQAGGVTVSGRIDLILNDTVVVFTPDEPLFANTTYTATLQPATDRFGNSQASGATYTFATLDTVPPTVETLTSTTGTTVTAGESVSIVAEASPATDVAFVEFFLDGELRRVDSTAPYEALIDIPSDATGDVVVSARATDAAGNQSTQKHLTLTVLADEPPTIATISPVAGTGVDAGSTVSVTVEAQDAVGVAQFFLQARGALDTDETVTVSPASTHYTATFALNIPADASLGSEIDVRASAADTAGQATSVVTTSLQVTGDAAPPTVAVVSPTAGTTVDRGETVDVVITARDNYSVTSIGLETTGVLSATDSQTITPAQTPVTATFQVTIPTAATGRDPMVITAHADDGFGNTAESISVTLDVRDTVSPQVTLSVTGGITQVVPGQSISVDVTATDAVGVAGVRIATEGAFHYTDTRTIEPTQTSVQERFDISVPATTAAGSVFTVTATAGDAAGNVGTAQPAALDVISDEPPTVTITSPPTGTVAGIGTQLDVTVQAQDDVGLTRVALEASGALSATDVISVTPAASDHTETFTLHIPDDALLDGVIDLRARVTDTRGLAGVSAPVAVTIADLTAPTVAIDAPADGTTVDPGETISVTITADDNREVTSITLTTGGAVSVTKTETITPATAPATATFSVTVPATATGNDVVRLTAQARDSAGNAAPSDEATLNVRDVIPPTGTLSGTPAAIQGTDVAVTVTGTDEVGVAALGLRAEGVVTTAVTHTVAPAQPVATHAFDVHVPATASAGGVFTVTATITDTAGNVGATQPATVTVVADEAPAVNLSVTPVLTEVVRGATITATTSATDDVGVSALGVTSTGAVTTQLSRVVSPTQASAAADFAFTVPATITAGSQLTLTGVATDTGSHFGTSAPITLTVVDPGGRVTGTVTDLNDQTVAGADVTVIAANGTFTTTTDTNGNYSAEDIAPGDVIVEAVDPATGQRGSTTGTLGHFELELQLDVQVTAAPLARITYPVSGDTFIEEQAISITVEASDDVGVASVQFLIDGSVRFTDTTAPYRYDTTVPTGVSSLLLGAIATDQEGFTGTAPDVQIDVIPDPLTTVAGRVVDTGGNPVAGATVTTLETYTATSASDGTFAIPNVPTIEGDLRVMARATVGGVELRGASGFVAPVRGGTTDVGDVLVREKVVWDGGGDGTSWDDPANWSEDTLPGPLDDVIISVAASPTVVHSQGVSEIRSLVSDESLVMSGGTLTATTTVQVNSSFEVRGGTLADATVLSGAGGSMLFIGTSALDGVTFDGVDLQLGANGGNNAAVTVRNGLTYNNATATLGRQGDSEWGRFDFEGTQVLTGTGTFVLANHQYNNYVNGLRVTQAGTTLTIGPNITVRGTDGFVGYSGDVSGSTDDVGVRLEGGRILSDGGGRVLLSGQHWRNRGGTIGATNGQLHLSNMTIDNVSSTLTLTGTQLIQLNGAGIVSGTVSSSITDSNRSRLRFINGGTLDGVTLDSVDLQLGANGGNNAAVTVRNGLTYNDATATLGRPGDREWGRFDFDGTQTLTGTATIELADHQYNNYVNGLRVTQAGTTLTIGPNITVRGTDGFVGYSGNVGGETDVGVSLEGGRILSDGGGRVLLSGQHWRNRDGTIGATNGQLFLNNTTIDNVSSTLTLTGTNLMQLNNAGIAGGTVSGVISPTANAKLRFINGGTLDGVTLESVDLQLGAQGGNNAAVTVRNGLTYNDGTATLGRQYDSEWGRFDVEGTQVLTGTGTFVLADHQYNNYVNGLRVTQAGTTLTIGPDITVRGTDGFVGYSGDVGGETNVGVSLEGGRILSDGGGRVLLSGQHWRNRGGTIGAPNGQLFLNNMTIDNVSSTLTLTGTNLMQLNNAGIAGGTVSGVISPTANAKLRFISSGLLDGVTMESVDLQLGAQGGHNAHVTVRNGLTYNDGTATLGRQADSEWGRFDVEGTQVLTGTGTFVLADHQYNNYVNGLRVTEAGTTFTLGPGITVRGTEGFIGYSGNHGGTRAMTVTNRSHVIADQSGGDIRLDAETVRNTGTVEQAGGSVTIVGGTTNAGQISPHSSPGVINVSGSYTQTLAGALTVDVGGTSVGSQYSRLATSNSATLGGVLTIALTNGYEPAVGDSFTIMTFGSRAGQFAAVNGLDIGNGKQFEVVYGDTDVTLNVVSSSGG